MSKKSVIPFSAEDLNEIVSLLDSGPYGELYLETDRFKLSLKRDQDGAWTQESQHLASPNIASGPVQASGEPAAQQSGAQEVVEGLVNVPAPMVGVFYRAPKPGAESFIEVGARVEEDTVIAIIEVMKLMNSIRAGVAGEVVEILKENAEFVEQGQTLIRVKPD